MVMTLPYKKDAFMHKVVFQLKNIEPYAQS